MPVPCLAELPPAGPETVGSWLCNYWSQPFITDTKVLASVKFHSATLLHIAPKHHCGLMQLTGPFQSQKIDFLQVHKRSVSTYITIPCRYVCGMPSKLLYSQLQLHTGMWILAIYESCQDMNCSFCLPGKSWWKSNKNGAHLYHKKYLSLNNNP